MFSVDNLSVLLRRHFTHFMRNLINTQWHNCVHAQSFSQLSLICVGQWIIPLIPRVGLQQHGQANYQTSKGSCTRQLLKASFISAQIVFFVTLQLSVATRAPSIPQYDTTYSLTPISSRTCLQAPSAATRDHIRRQEHPRPRSTCRQMDHEGYPPVPFRTAAV